MMVSNGSGMTEDGRFIRNEAMTIRTEIHRD